MAKRGHTLPDNNHGRECRDCRPAVVFPCTRETLRPAESNESPVAAAAAVAGGGGSGAGGAGSRLATLDSVKLPPDTLRKLLDGNRRCN